MRTAMHAQAKDEVVSQRNKKEGEVAVLLSRSSDSRLRPMTKLRRAVRGSDAKPCL